MNRVFKSAAFGLGSWLILFLMLGASVVQPVLAQDDDDEPLNLASGNKMQTDSLTTNTFSFSSLLPSEDVVEGQVQLPATGRAKVGENNSAIPQDRFFFVYKHFHNSLATILDDGGGGTFGGTPTVRGNSFDRYNFGLEKAFNDGLWSVELRMPLSGSLDYDSADFSQRIGGIGNLSVIGKLLLLETQTVAWSAGLGVSAPTGDDSEIQVGNELFTIGNDTAYLFPFIGFLSVPTQKTFVQGFLQLDIATNDNDLLLLNRTAGAPAQQLGSLRDQTMMYLDLSAGYNLYENPGARGITGISPVIELHYTTSLESTNTVAGNTGVDATEFTYSNPANQIDVVNMGGGFYANLSNGATMYMGVVAPLGTGTKRFFDTEAQISINFGY